MMDRDAALLCSDPLFRKTDRHIERKLRISRSLKSQVRRTRATHGPRRGRYGVFSSVGAALWAFDLQRVGQSMRRCV